MPWFDVTVSRDDPGEAVPPGSPAPVLSFYEVEAPDVETAQAEGHRRWKAEESTDDEAYVRVVPNQAADWAADIENALDAGDDAAAERVMLRTPKATVQSAISRCRTRNVDRRNEAARGTIAGGPVDTAVFDLRDRQLDALRRILDR